MAKKPASKLTVETLKHDEATRKNIPTAEYQSVMQKDELTPVRVAYERRNRDLDPQLVWRGKDEQDWSDLVVHAPPLYIQEKVHPKVLIDDLKRQTEQAEAGKAANQSGFTTDLFGDFNGLPDENAKTEFYQHDAHWANRMILGDSLQVMASLAEREGLRGKVQCIYFDPPYGIKFNSNFQWSTANRDVKDGNAEHITREPEQVKAFRDTWRDGIHSYLTYLRDRLTVARDLLADSGSIFVQIGDENLHLVSSLMAEVFGAENSVIIITFRKTNKALGASLLGGVTDYIVWYAKNKKSIKFRKLKDIKNSEDNPSSFKWCEEGGVRRSATPTDIAAFLDGKDVHFFTPVPLTSSGYTETCIFDFEFNGRTFASGSRKSWATTKSGVEVLKKANRIFTMGNTPFWVQYFKDLSTIDLDNVWQDTRGELAKSYVVQTSSKVVERCILMTTDPGDLVIDPTCGSATTAYVAEQWGRRWITMDTSRVALALARARIMGARYPYYLLADSRDGQIKEAEVTHTIPSIQPVRGNIRQGFVYEREPHITLKSIANNSEVDVIWGKWQQILEPLLEQLNKALGNQWREWEIPRDVDAKWSDAAKKLHTDWWHARIARQNEIDASIAAKAEFEFLYDKPYEDKKKVVLCEIEWVIEFHFSA